MTANHTTIALHEHVGNTSRVIVEVNGKEIEILVDEDGIAVEIKDIATGKMLAGASADFGA